MPSCSFIYWWHRLVYPRLANFQQTLFAQYFKSTLTRCYFCRVFCRLSDHKKKKNVRYIKSQFKIVFKNYLHEIGMKHLISVKIMDTHTWKFFLFMQKVFRLQFVAMKSPKAETPSVLLISSIKIQPTATAIDFATSLVLMAARNVAADVWKR